MTERPILFSGPMVRAILDGRKTQTRRVLKPQPENVSDKIDAVLKIKAGDTLWVREAHSIHRTHGQHRDDGQRWGPWNGLPTTFSPDRTQIAYYREGFDRCKDGPWLPSIHMPRWASRISLKVTGVKVERLQDISEGDAIAEGILACEPTQDDPAEYAGAEGRLIYNEPREAFCDLWRSINGADSWKANPWVVAYSFQRIKP